jgi:HAD superfamily hydrolase (TIGR01509 family)
MSATRAVVFDMDGLIFNTEEVYMRVGTELLRRRGREFTAELADAMMGLPPRPAFELMIRWHDLHDTWQELLPESDEIFVRLLDDHLAPMPGLLELLGALETAGIPKAIATSSGREIVGDVLLRADLRSRFQFVLTAEDVTRGKPHPEIYLLAAERFGLSPRQTLVLEDSANGCRAAAAAGAFTVAVPGAHSRNHDFSAASLVVESLGDPRLYEVLRLGPPAA